MEVTFLAARTPIQRAVIGVRTAVASAATATQFRSFLDCRRGHFSSSGLQTAALQWLRSAAASSSTFASSAGWRNELGACELLHHRPQ